VGIKFQVMRYVFFFICLGFAGTALGQHERHGNSKPWEVIAGYQLPVGKWAEQVDVNVPGRPVYYASFSGKTGQHARMGFHAGVCYTRTSVSRSGFAKNFRVMLYPGIFSVVFYDLESNGPAIATSKIKPWMQYEAVVAPCYGIRTGGNTLKFFARFGIGVKHTAGEVHFAPSNATPEIDPVKYSYTGVGVTIGPGVKFITGRISIAAEMQFGYTTGKYKGGGANTVPNSIFGSQVLGVSVGYAFGG
jgi:hypothetical protein